MHFLLSTQRGLVISLLGSVAIIDVFIALFCFPHPAPPTMAGVNSARVTRLTSAKLDAVKRESPIGLRHAAMICGDLKVESDGEDTPSTKLCGIVDCN